MKKQVNVRPTIVVQGGRRARSPAIIDTASNHGGLFVEPVRKWMEEESQKAPTVNLSAVGRPLHNIYMISTSLFILIVGIISVFLPSLSLSKVFLVSIIAIFRAALTQLCILAPPACWLVLSAADLIASHKNLQQSNFCQVDHSSFYRTRFRSLACH